MKGVGLQFLRPYLWNKAKPIHTRAGAAHARFFTNTSTRCSLDTFETQSIRSGDVQKRIQELEAMKADHYPRITHDPRSLTCKGFRQRYAPLKADENKEDEIVTIRGRVHKSRIAGSKLVFFDLVQDGQRVQGICNLGRLKQTGVTAEQFKQFYHVLRRGDIFSITGIPQRTRTGELSVNAISIPRLLSPSLHRLPTELLDKETRIRNKHSDLLVNQESADILRLRSHMIQFLRDFFLDDGFLEVSTPILAGSAGGAVARPFTTSATEFPELPVNLRIAPELWLKRLILGGVDRVFEIGPSFRNEGLDASHNPEFTSCEFYKSFADLENLIAMTEALFSGLARFAEAKKEVEFTSLSPLNVDFSTPFKRVEFIPGIESAINRKLPDLASPGATSNVIRLFQEFSIPIPHSPTLPRLLDKLSSLYIEPHCSGPTFVAHHPECLSPLSKSFIDPTTKQRVSSRVELFIQSREIVNAYEEENSPFEQRRKFNDQVKWKDNENEANIDENYLEALEWGLPPTGGWGCGVDRLCMLFLGAKRIGDVLSFGNLRNVVGLAGEIKR
ncbi:MAG: hypothetical protein M1827_001225 [Pycnora praestabilis]|nr:MAG: hypothetical protein M1827_001225 [Pycnora praestabilis]